MEQVVSANRRAGLFLLLLVVVVNLNAFTAFFVGDDYDFLRLVGARDSLLDVVAVDFWGEWEPLWYLSWAIDYRLWELNPFGYHLTNVLWLAVAVFALFGLVRELWPSAPFAAWTAALLFAVHPLHDEAVTYLAARGHVICLALSLLAVWLYARARSSAAGRRRRWRLIATALVLALLAALAKEIALLIAVWIGTIEWLVIEPARHRGRALLSGLGWGGLFLAPSVVAIGLRAWVVGLDSDKLAGVGDAAELLGEMGRELPSYALLGALPIPFGFLDLPAVERLAPLGWAVLLGGVGCGLAALTAAALKRRDSPALGLLALGLVVSATSLAPVFWAGLRLHRRYLFMPSAGIVLVVAVAIAWLYQRRPRLARSLLLVLVLLGAAGTLYRNALYRGAGQVARVVIEGIRGAPVDQRARRAGNAPKAFLVAMPRRYGGDALSGAYLFHYTDLRSAYALFDIRQNETDYALAFDHADDHTVEVLSASPEELRLRFSFRTNRAFLNAIVEDPARRGHGNSLEARRIAGDPERRTLDYIVNVAPALRRTGAEIYLYSDGGLTRVLPER